MVLVQKIDYEYDIALCPIEEEDHAINRFNYSQIEKAKLALSNDVNHL